MSTTGSRLLSASCIAALSFLLVAQVCAASIVSRPITAAPEPDATRGTSPEIVRLSLVDGDVRITRGKRDAKLTGNTWEQAAAGIPLQSGFSLATGPNGRAEIELEDASTVYLGPDTALSLPNLTTRDGVPHTTVTLLSGTVAINIRTDIPGESFVMETPTHAINIAYGDVNFSRISSYLDGLRVTPLEDTHLVLNRINRVAPAGTTYTLRGLTVRKSTSKPAPEIVAFDAWVQQRVAARNEAMRSVMKQAGLTTPLPGLADLAGKGTFVPCAPYGTCWKPDDGWMRRKPASAVPQAAPGQIALVRDGAPHILDVSMAMGQAAAQSNERAANPYPEPSQAAPSTMQVAAMGAPQFGGYGPDYFDDFGDFDAFPCDPFAFWYEDSLSLYPADFYPYDWAVCHAGFWIYGPNNQYMWVVGTHRHHHCPVKWVRYQGKLAFVPEHPRDRRGAPPVNLRHGFYTLSQRSGRTGIERIAFNPKSPPRVLDSTPKQFRNPAPMLLARAEAPSVGLHFMHEVARRGDNGRGAGEHHGNAFQSRTASSSLVFDQHSNRFMLATRVTEGGRTRTFTAPMSDRGGRIASASSGGYHPSFSGGAPSRAGFAGGGLGRAGGGDMRGGGGGFSGGGGGSHGGGGGAASGGGGHR